MSKERRTKTEEINEMMEAEIGVKSHKHEGRVGIQGIQLTHRC